jgi:hypothetical protein
MTTDIDVLPRPNNSGVQAILLGGFAAGLADFLYASIRRIMNGGTWMDPWKSVASGLLGQDARSGGLGMVLLGVALHFFICFVAAAMLYYILKRLTWLPRQWFVLGVIYGIVFLAVMNYVILPLSQIGRPIYPLANMHVSIFWHIVLVGVTTSFFITRPFRPIASP